MNKISYNGFEIIFFFVFFKIISPKQSDKATKRDTVCEDNWENVIEKKGEIKRTVFKKIKDKDWCAFKFLQEKIILNIFENKWILQVAVCKLAFQIFYTEFILS